MANSDLEPRGAVTAPAAKPRGRRRGAKPAEVPRVEASLGIWDAFVIWDLGSGLRLASLPQLGVA